MKIIHVVKSLDPAMGGLPAAVLRLASGEALYGHEVSIATYSDPDNDRTISKFVDSIPYMERVKIVDCGKASNVERITARRAFRTIDQAAKGHDVIHLHGVWDPILPAAARVANAQRIPYVVTPHGMLDPWCLGQKPWKKRIALRLGYLKLLNQSSFIHFLNEDERKLAIPLGCKAASVIIANGLFSQELDDLPEEGSFLAEHDSQHRRPYVLFLSRLHYKKGLDILATAFGHVVGAGIEADLVVSGPDGGALADFNSRVESLGIEKYVRVTGPLYGREKLAAFVDASVFCLPSRQEGFSMAILEALGCGTPVVVSQECHFPELETAGVGRVVTLDPTDVGNALIEFLNDLSSSRAVSSAARQFMLSSYTCEKIAERMISAYQHSSAG